MDITNSLQYIILVNPTETDGADASPDTAACFYQRLYSVLRALYLSSTWEERLHKVCFARNHLGPSAPSISRRQRQQNVLAIDRAALVTALYYTDTSCRLRTEKSSRRHNGRS
jgi:hypothetical protein